MAKTYDPCCCVLWKRHDTNHAGQFQTGHSKSTSATALGLNRNSSSLGSGLGGSLWECSPQVFGNLWGPQQEMLQFRLFVRRADSGMASGSRPIITQPAINRKNMRCSASGKVQAVQVQVNLKQISWLLNV